ncbi:BlaI/MecI/CopY family transcriptional regulator [Pseudoteredinibacter isoporae]|uniref:Putative transcriptional regulator n=1 Tax=Pseudoteredinibacter isoporae TaxID=570281 RepID=A0A7X0JV63_9GAMM|nr:BlaI/MecI/CopY family transcriptional regulator [Pseudoteredinibacter isoporae]MBB6522867.1 putative transcriptional regulator [Pseudoteredinibacter isoporae]NHO88393.1 BlaI/MecI/CopY family transcriptional regulator [Pseudoteredinibacter isoporae]NIB23276.1 BlaI/MecI/CopY family transcriptional regulator [Pseudoteredinibacter isoporae]
MNDNIKVTELELRIFQCIWQLDNLATVNSIIEHWPDADAPGYTTVLKTLQKMESKSLVDHQKQGKQHAYFSLVNREEVTAGRLGTIIKRLFSGNKLSFAEYFLQENEFSQSELDELKALIEEKEGGRKNGHK